MNTRPSPLTVFALLVLDVASTAGCSLRQAGPQVVETADPGTPPAATFTSFGGPSLDELARGVPNLVKPGGATTCSRGGEFAFVVTPGDREHVIVEFEGGGACWDERTCSFADAIFRDSIDPAAYRPEAPRTGFHDTRRAEHPMRDWTHVYVPYCTGDLHWGDNVATYGAGESAITIRHKGATNVRAVLGWLYAQIAAPQKVFVTGCSAGGYGSVWWAPHVQEHWRAAKVYQFSDSAAGIITRDFFDKSFPAWNAFASFAPSLGDPAGAQELSTIYLRAAAKHPAARFAQFNTEEDASQSFYFTTMGGKDVATWSESMRASVKTIADGAKNFSAFIAPGEQHCVLPFDAFYSTEVNGTKLTRWLADMIADAPLPSPGL